MLGAILVLATFAAVEAPQLYHFSSENCPACREVEPTVAQLEAQGVPLVHVDAHQRPEWTRQARVDALPTFIVVADGQEVGRLVGVASFRELSQLYLQAVQQMAAQNSQASAASPAAVNQTINQNLQAANATSSIRVRPSGFVDRDQATSRTANDMTDLAQAGSTQSDLAQSETENEEMVRGQNPRRARAGERLSRALNSLTGRTKNCAQCPGACQCSPDQNCDPRTGVCPIPDSNLAPQFTDVLPVGHEVPVSSGVVVEQGIVVGNARSAGGSVSLTQACIDCATAATVRLKVVDELGQSFGTGTIIDVHQDEALVLTCGHIFRESEGKGRVLCDSFAPGATPGIEGKLISYDVRRDVGLVSFRPGVPVKPALIGGTGHRPLDNDSVFSIGCNKGADPTVIKNRVIAVNRYHGPPNIVVGGRPVDGRSGGGLFTENGLLIGVCNAADPEFDEGLYAALGNVHAELDSVGLGFIYRKQQPEIALGEKRTPQSIRPSYSETRPTTGLPSNHNDMPDDQVLPVVGVPNNGLLDRDQTNTDEQPQARSIPHADTERMPQLVATIRTPEDPNRRVDLVIERPSRELLDQLSREANSRGPHQQTQLQIKRNSVAEDGDWRSLAPVGNRAEEESNAL